jgi:hypothetical protein
MFSKKELTKLLAVRWNLLTAEQKQVSSYSAKISVYGECNGNETIYSGSDLLKKSFRIRIVSGSEPNR